MTAPSNGKRADFWQTAARVLGGLVVSVIVVAATYIAGSVRALEIQQTKTDATRWSRKDHDAYAADAHTQQDVLENQLNNIEKTTIRNEVKLQGLAEDIAEIKAAVTR